MATDLAAAQWPDPIIPGECKIREYRERLNQLEEEVSRICKGW